MTNPSQNAPSEEVVTARRRGRWAYIRGLGWRLDGTDLVLDFDRLNRSCGVGGRDSNGCYVLSGGGHYDVPIDKFLDGAMAFVEEEYADG